ncbi:MAG: SDR family oxidoreductase [Bacilli bacterium]|nr:SDR family oxidoreductase [Bacilli bacterium]
MAKYALVTGGSGGIGKEIATLLAKDGHNLLLVARSQDKLEEVKKEIEEQYHVEVVVFAADLGKEENIDALFEFTGKSRMEIDILINNAGYGNSGKFIESDWNREKGLVNLNILALMKLIRLYAPLMKERGEGHIMNIASVAAYLPGPNMASYYASKAYVLSFGDALYYELKGTGVTSTSVCPGPVGTNFFKNTKMKVNRMGQHPMDVKKAAKIAYKAFKKGKRTVNLGFGAKSLMFFTRFFSRGFLAKMDAPINE